MKKTFAMAALLFGGLLAACSFPGLSSMTPLAAYDFGLRAARPDKAQVWPDLTLEVHAPEWIDALPMAYRLAYAEAQKLHQYAASRWVGAPSRLLSDRLQDRLGMQAAPGSASACQLRLELQEFSQIFDDLRQSRGVLQLQARLFDSRRRFLLERRFRFEVPAATPDASGGAAALAFAVEQLGNEIELWLNQSAQSGQSNSCRLSATTG